MLKFKIKHYIKQKRITLQLENILNPKKIETVDSKIHDFSILTTKKQGTIGAKKKMQKRIIDEFRIEGLQNFNQYTNINPISIAITESEIQSKLSFYSKKYQYRFIVNNLLFSSSIQKDTNVIFIATNRLNDAKEALINGKMLQLIGVMNLSQIICWDNIKKTSHWAKAVFIDSDYPKGAQHFVFAFETTDLHNLLNFEYSLLEDEGKLVKFEEGEDKIPAINFTTQIVG